MSGRVKQLYDSSEGLGLLTAIDGNFRPAPLAATPALLSDV